jgi:hypothetical protein
MIDPAARLLYNISDIWEFDMGAEALSSSGMDVETAAVCLWHEQSTLRTEEHGIVNATSQPLPIPETRQVAGQSS